MQCVSTICSLSIFSLFPFGWQEANIKRSVTLTIHTNLSVPVLLLGKSFLLNYIRSKNKYTAELMFFKPFWQARDTFFIHSYCSSPNKKWPLGLCEAPGDDLIRKRFGPIRRPNLWIRCSWIESGQRFKSQNQITVLRIGQIRSEC